MSQTLIIGFREKFEEFFRLRGSKIRVLEFGFFDLSFLSLLLPFTSSLKSLKIQFRNPSNLNRRPSLSNMISLLSFLPIDTPLYMLDISSFYLNLSSDADCLIPLLVLPQLSKLRKLYCTDSTPITRLKFRPKSLEGKKVEVIREGSKELLKMIEFSERSGVQLIPRSENDERISRIKILRQMKVIKNWKRERIREIGLGDFTTSLICRSFFCSRFQIIFRRANWIIILEKFYMTWECL